MRNLFLQAKQLTSATTGRFGHVLWTKSVENTCNNGGPRTSYSMTMVHWCILLYQCNNIWLLKTQCGPPPHLLTHLIWTLLSSCSWEWNHSYEGIVDRMSLKFQTVADCITCDPKVTSSTGRSAGHVASTQKGTSTLKGTTTNKKSGTYFIINSLQELLDMLSYTEIKQNMFHKIVSCLLWTTAVCRM